MSRRRSTARPDQQAGARGEAIAAAWLRARGFRIVARNLRTVHGELDLLVRRGRDYAAVEVKTRTDHPAPERAVHADRLQRMTDNLLALANDLRPRPTSLRLDVVAVRLQGTAAPEVRHFPAVRSLAWPAPRATRATGRWRRPEGGCYAWPMAPGHRHRLRHWLWQQLQRLRSAMSQLWPPGCRR